MNTNEQNAERAMTKTKITVTQTVCIAVGAAIISVCSWISFPMASGISVTLQTFAVFLVTSLLGLKCGTISVLVYLLLGMVGVPVFSGFKGGLAVLSGVTGGYLIGFIFTALITGFIIKKFGRKTYVLAIAMVLGLAACYLFGSVWFMVLYTSTDGSTMAFATVLATCVVPYLVPDAIKIAAAIALVKALSANSQFRHMMSACDKSFLK